MTDRLISRWAAFGWSAIGIVAGTVVGASALAIVWFVVIPFFKFIVRG